MAEQKIEDQDGEGNVVLGSTNPADGKRRMLKLITGELLIGNTFPVGDDGTMRIDKPMVVQMVQQGQGRVSFGLFPMPCEIFWLHEGGIVGEGEMNKAIENNYIQATTGLQMAPANNSVAPRGSIMA